MRIDDRKQKTLSRVCEVAGMAVSVPGVLETLEAALGFLQGTQTHETVSDLIDRAFSAAFSVCGRASERTDAQSAIYAAAMAVVYAAGAAIEREAFGEFDDGTHEAFLCIQKAKTFAARSRIAELR